MTSCVAGPSRAHCTDLAGPKGTGGARRCGQAETGRSGWSADSFVAVPHLARAAMDLAHVCRAARRAEALEFLRRRIEAQHRLRAPLRHPHLVSRIDIHRVHARLVARRAPRRPLARRGLVAAEVPRVPFPHPAIPLGVGPHAPRALLPRRRLDLGSGSSPHGLVAAADGTVYYTVVLPSGFIFPIPRCPLPCAENHTGPFGTASAHRSWMPWPLGTGYSCTVTCANAGREMTGAKAKNFITGRPRERA